VRRAAAAVLRDTLIHAGVACVLVAPSSVYAIYRLLTPLFRRLAADMFDKDQAEQP
jgi:hypothetical protein